MNNNVNCIHKDIYLCIFMIQNLEIWKQSSHGIFLSFPVAVCFFLAFFIIS